MQDLFWLFCSFVVVFGFGRILLLTMEQFFGYCFHWGFIGFLGMVPYFIDSFVVFMEMDEYAAYAIPPQIAFPAKANLDCLSCFGEGP